MKAFCFLFAVFFVAVQTLTHDEEEQADDFPILDGEMEQANFWWPFSPGKRNETDQFKAEVEARCRQKNGICRRRNCRRNEKLVDFCGFLKSCCSRKNSSAEYF